MQNNGDKPVQIPIAKLDADDIAEHFARYWTKVNANPSAEVLDVRQLALITYMTGFRAALQIVTQDDLTEPMSELMGAVALIDELKQREE